MGVRWESLWLQGKEGLKGKKWVMAIADVISHCADPPWVPIILSLLELVLVTL